MEWTEALDLCEEILDLLDDLPTTDAAIEFGESVKERVTSIQTWIEDNEFVTPKQVEVLENTKSGVAKWIH